MSKKKLTKSVNKKADVKISPLIKIILVVLVVVIVFVGVFSFDMYKFFRNLPDFFGGDKPSDELYTDARIYDVEVRILKNDGEGRCVVAEVPEGEGYDWLKSYGVRNGELEIDGKVVSSMGWMTQDMVDEKILDDDLASKEDELIEIINNNENDYFRNNINLYGGLPFGSEITRDFNSVPINTPTDFDEISDLHFYMDTQGKDRAWVKYDKDMLAFSDFIEVYIKEKGWDLKIICDSLEDSISGRLCLLEVIGRNGVAFSGDELYGCDDYNDGKCEGIWNKWDNSGIKNQIIKQELMEACYSDDEDFKITQILLRDVTLLLKNNDFGDDGKCIIYESEEDGDLEHYGIKYAFLGSFRKKAKLYLLEGNGDWKDIDESLPSPDEIRIIPLMKELIQKEEELIDYIDKTYEDLCGDYMTIPTPVVGDYSDPIAESDEGEDICQINGEVYNAISDVYLSKDISGLNKVYDGENPGTDNKNPGIIENSIDEFLSLSGYEIICVDVCVLSNYGQLKGLGVMGGKIYEFKDGGLKLIEYKGDYRYFNRPIEDWAKLLRERSIKLGLINECKR